MSPVMTPNLSGFIGLCFPTELILEIIQQLPFKEHTISTLASVHPRIKAVLESYEVSVTKNIAHHQLPHVFTDFPRGNSAPSYAWLAQCIRQYDTADDIMATLTSKTNHFAVLPHNMAVVNAGILLLYQLHADKIAFLKGLSRDPLIAIWLVVHSAAIRGRYYGKGIINQKTYAKLPRHLNPTQVQFRDDIEFAFREGALTLGPDFIAAAFYNEDGAESTLICFYHQHTARPVEPVALGNDFQPPITEGPMEEPGTRPCSLVTTLVECLKELYGFNVTIEDLVMGIIDIDTADDGHPLARLTLSGKARLLQGLNVT